MLTVISMHNCDFYSTADNFNIWHLIASLASVQVCGDHTIKTALGLGHNLQEKKSYYCPTQDDATRNTGWCNILGRSFSTHAGHHGVEHNASHTSMLYLAQASMQ